MDGEFAGAVRKDGRGRHVFAQVRSLQRERVFADVVLADKIWKRYHPAGAARIRLSPEHGSHELLAMLTLMGVGAAELFGGLGVVGGRSSGMVWVAA
jgi:hypothetical protein